MENEGAETVKSERVENGRFSRVTNKFPFSKKKKKKKLSESLRVFHLIRVVRDQSFFLYCIGLPY